MDILVLIAIVIIILAILGLFFRVFLIIWPFVLIAAIIYAIVNAFRKDKKNDDAMNASQTTNDDPNVIDVDYKVVDEKREGDK